MKRFFFICITLLLLLPIPIRSQITKTVTLTFPESDFFLSRFVDSLYIIDSHNHNIFLKSDTLLPALPYISVRVLIGPNDDYTGFSFNDDEVSFKSGIILAPNPTCMTTDNPIPTRWCPTVYYSPTVYPFENVEYNGIRWLHGFKMVSFLVCPFRYDTVTGEIFLKNQITLNLTLHQGTDSREDNSERKVSPVNERHLATIKQIVVNSSDAESLYGVSSVSSQPKSVSAPYEYIIITNEGQESQYQRIADWKTRKGVRTKVLTTEAIDTIYPNVTPKSMRIKTAIRDYYQQGARYALLGGDTCVVPAQQCFIHVIASGDTISKTTVTDLFYSCFQNMNWDTNGNGVWGEVEDSVQILPEIALTRVPSENSTHAQIFVDRLLEFEMNPVYDNWKNQILMSGNQLGLISDDAEIRGDSIFYTYIHPYWSGTQFKLYNSMTDYPQGASYELNASHLQTELEKGYPFVHMITHGQSFYWYLESGCYFDSNAQSLNNSGYSIIATTACHTNSFDQPSSSRYCLSEYFLKNANSGVLAYLGSSREGITKGWFSLGASDLYNGHFFHYLFLKYNYGEAVRLAKIVMEPNCLSYGSERWIHFALNPLGDPEMPVYLSSPKSFNGVAYSLYNGKLILDACAGDCRICVMDANGGDTFYHVETFDRWVEIDGVQPGYLVCVTKQDHIPWTATLSQTGNNEVYIQNTTYTSDHTIVAKKAYIGSDVTSSLPNGAVTVQSGSVSIRATDLISIKDDFEVKTGASFEAEILNDN